MDNEIITETERLFQQRHLDWPDCYNARDLGGLPAENGRMTRWRSVIRSDILNRLTAEGQQALLDYGARTIIDLRSPEEVAKEPSLSVEETSDLAYLNLPLEAFYPHVSALIMKAETRGEVYCIILDHYPDLIGKVMQAIGEARPGGIVIHCHAGKDRTGMIAGLLLRLVGVADEIIWADYAESQSRLRPRYERIVKEEGAEDKVDFWGRPTATEEMMQMMLDHIDVKYGGVEAYLETAGLSLREIEQLMNRICKAGD